MKRTPPSNPQKFDSLLQCSAATGIPLLVLKRAKRNGCPAFRSSRVELYPFLKWYFEQDASVLDLPTLQAEQVQLQNEKLTAQNSILRREWVAADDVRTWGAQLGAACKKVVSALHLSAPNLTGLSVVEISNALKQQEAEILTQFSTLDDQLARHETESRHELFQPEARP